MAWWKLVYSSVFLAGFCVRKPGNGNYIKVIRGIIAKPNIKKLSKKILMSNSVGKTKSHEIPAS